MADTLTQLIAKVQAQLLDAGTLFTTATVTAAARQALAGINDRVPERATVTIATVVDQKEYELTDQDTAAIKITGVYLEGSNEYDTPLPFDAYMEDSRVFFRLRCSQPAGNTLLVHYTRPHTINGLDSATDSTLPDRLNVAAIDGSCFYCCLIRAAATVEANNVEQRVTTNWLEIATKWQALFFADLADAARQPLVVGEPDTAAWNDPQHSDQYP